MKKNDEFIIDITDVTAEGNGVGRCDGIAVFVPNTAVGDKVKVHIVKVKKNFCFGKAVEIIELSKDRVEEDCPVFTKCGGCVYRHISYDCELKLKQKRVEETMRRIGGINISASPILSGDDKRYRNKAQYPIDDGGEVGFFAVHSHRIIPVKDCLLQPKEFSVVANALKDYMQRFSISAYNEESGKGVVRHLYIRKATVTGEIMVALVINAMKLNNTDYLINRLKEILGDNFKTFVLNINTEKTNVILGKENIVLYGDGYITDILRDNKIRINPLSFYQVNRNMAEILYKKAEEYLEPDNKNILDLYCGAGTIGLSFAKKAKSIIGVEIIPEAIEDAKFNAKLNGIENARFICSDASNAAKILRDEGIKVDGVVLDPPRKGCEAELLSVIAYDFAPEKIVYVSCDVATLARDVKILEEKGYKVAEYTPVDLFPRTSHVETVVCLSREKADESEKESNMISDERSKYKSWSNLKKQMNNLLCDSLKDKITYFYTSYHEVNNAYGRATINCNKKELVAFSWDIGYAKWDDEYTVLNETNVNIQTLGSFQAVWDEQKRVQEELNKSKWMPEGKLCETDFINAVTNYLKTDITTSLRSDNYLLRIFAYMDRRVGKRTLVKIQDEVEKLPDWVKQFYQIRCEADGIVFPPKRNTDETVALLIKGENYA